MPGWNDDPRAWAAAGYRVPSLLDYDELEQQQLNSRPVNLLQWGRTAGNDITRAMGNKLMQAGAEYARNPTQGKINALRGLGAGVVRGLLAPVDMVSGMAQATSRSSIPQPPGSPSDLLANPIRGESNVADVNEFLGGLVDPSHLGLLAGALPLIGKTGRAAINAFKAGRAALRAGGVAEDALKAGNQFSHLPQLNLTGAFAPATTPARGAVGEALELAQRRVLTPQELERLTQAQQQYPSLQQASNYFTPEEMSSTLASSANVRKVSHLLDILPQAAEIAAVAKAGMPKLGWYRASTQAIMDVFGDDAPRFASLLAALSPQTSVESNLQNTLSMWKNWTAAGRPRDAEMIKRILGQSVQGSGTEASVLGAWLNNATRALSSENPVRVTLSGPKVNSFFRNLQDDVFAVTNDTWMANGFSASQNIFKGNPTEQQLARGNPGLSPGYIAASARQRQAGDLIGYMPDETQETIWSVYMPMLEGANKRGMDARDFLQKGLLTPDVIAGTPDFSSLLHEGPYRNILEQAGYGQQVGALRPHGFTRQAGTLTSDDQRMLERAAGRLSDLQVSRGNERSGRVFPGAELQPSEVWGHTSIEAIPYAASGQLPNVGSGNLSARTAFTQRMHAPFTNEQGKDRLNSAVFGPQNVLETRNSTGLYEREGLPREIQPAYSLGVRTPVNYGEKTGAPSVPNDFLNTVDYVNSWRGGLLGQGGVPFNVGVPRKNGPDMFVPLEAKIDPANMLAAAQNKQPSVVIADTGTGPLVFDFKGRRLKRSERNALTRDVGGTTYHDAKKLGRYTSYESELDATKNPPGSGAMTDALIAKSRRVTPEVRAKVDEQVKAIATELLSTRASYAGKKPGQADVVMENFLRAAAKGGLKTVKAARKAGVALPAALLALLPNDEDERSGRSPAPGLLTSAR